MSNGSNRRKNEKKFSNWEDLPNGGRKYYIEIIGRHGWKAKYVKEVDTNEETTKFYREIYDNRGNLIEIHEKFPVDMRHRKIKEK
ncbi:MAG: hypothetical protein IIB44_01875 [Candidatus Marinimicrobia bacterium]|nr:hypothetical protein [Candidatus Neomarinimicrobiota bacterium]MCH8069854.1 hypothetical protein [Candidatus Neomarinimicrobiota bacterium]